MSVVALPIFRLRKRVGEIRHLKIEAGELMHGDVADLSSHTSRQLSEIWCMPEGASAFLPQMLQCAAVTQEELIDHCDSVGMRTRILNAFFTNLSVADAEWYLEVMERRLGFTIRVIVGHHSAMQLAQDHGFLPEILNAKQRTVRRFAFGQ